MNCRICEEEIPAARLKALPGAKYCVNCQSESESVVPITRRGRVDTNGLVLVGGESIDPAEELKR